MDCPVSCGLSGWEGVVSEGLEDVVELARVRGLKQDLGMAEGCLMVDAGERLDGDGENMCLRTER